MDDRERLIVLNLMPEIGTIRLNRLLEAFGSLTAVFAASARQVQQIQGIRSELAEKIRKACATGAGLAQELAEAKRAGCRIVTKLDQEYPEPLRTIPDPPIVLYMKGQWEPRDQVAVALVGSRICSEYGRQMTQRLATDLAGYGITVVSGLARGIDAAAHLAALKAGGRTIAVLGGGLASIYPPEHAELAERIVRQGAVMSEYPMRMEPLAWNFPRRNRLVSGLSLGVVVVEAAHKSGALITADCALEQGREVFAVPGPATARNSEGVHGLLRQGARLATGVDDILEELGLTPEQPSVATPKPAARNAAPAASETMDELLAAITNEPCELDALAQRSGLPAGACAAQLLRLELEGRVRQLPGKRFMRNG